MKRIIKANLSIFVSPEGEKDEKAFLQHLKNIYNPKSNRISFKVGEEYGGNAVQIINRAIIEDEDADYNHTFVIVDEDRPLEYSNDVQSLCINLQKLWELDEEIPTTITLYDLKELNIKNKKPIIIVSHPMNFEGFLLPLLGLRMPALKEPRLEHNNATINIKKLKNRFKYFMKRNYGEYTFNSIVKCFGVCLPREVLEEKIKFNKELFMLVKLLRGDSL